MASVSPLSRVSGDVGGVVAAEATGSEDMVVAALRKISWPILWLLQQ
jgi:hypothetical protein